MLDKIYTKQTGLNDCALACIMMILKYKGKEVTTKQLNNLIKLEKNGVTVYEIRRILDIFGFRTLAIKADSSLFCSKEIEYPIIVHIIKKGLNHYCVIFNSVNGDLIIGDPDPNVGIKKTPIKKFVKVWTGVTIIIS